MTILSLAAYVFCTEAATKAQLVSVRRALRSLERKGLARRIMRQSGRQAALCKSPKRKSERIGEKDSSREHGVNSHLVLRDQCEPFGGASKRSAILGMMGSAHEGEILAAAHKAEALRRKLGKTWREILGM